MKFIFSVFNVICLIGIFVNGELPNIIIIVADDMGFNDVGFHGATQIPTPNLDALAYSGVILNNYYVQPLCTPSRAALMTGIYPIHLGLNHDVIYGPQAFGLPLDKTILPQYLKQKGYATHMVGKWHLGICSHDYLPINRGFDSHFGHWTAKLDYYQHTNQEDVGWKGFDMRRNMDVEWNTIGKYNTDLFANETVKIIEDHNVSSPLFLYMAHTAVHSANPENPLQAPQYVIDSLSYIEDEDRRIYAAMMWKMDESVGRLVKALESKGILQNSIIIFTSDNGGAPAGLNQNAASNWPLRGAKSSYWEGGVRGAAFVWSPLLSNPGRVSHQMMHITDWVPSLLSAIGGGFDLEDIDGIDVWSHLADGSSNSSRNEVLLNIDPIDNSFSLRDGEWKLVYNPFSGDEYYGAWISPSGRNGTSLEESWELILENIFNSSTASAVKRIYPDAYSNIQSLITDAEVKCDPVPSDATYTCPESSDPCLFNIVNDPCEYYDVSKDYPFVLQSLFQKIQEYNSTLVDPLNTEWFEAAHPKYWNGTWTNWLDYPMPVTEQSLSLS